MGVTTYEAIVEDGQIRLPTDVRLPESARVYVVVPGIEMVRTAYLRSPRLAHPEQAKGFVMEVLEEDDRDAAV